MRFFNTAGPVKCDIHYCIPPLTRFDLGDMLALIDQQKYFVLHAPRQVGKTSYLLALMAHLNEQGKYRALYFNVEVGQSAREDVGAGMGAIVGELASRAEEILGDSYPMQVWREAHQLYEGHILLNRVLTLWSRQSSRPLVLLIDEIDSLIGDTLISVLRQLRSGYDKRPRAFPQSVILCGVRDVRDYRIHSSQDKAVITGGSAFNIRSMSLRMDNFDRAEVEALYAQHTAETGQPFSPEALELAWELTAGQPWLVNALAYETCFEMREGRNRATPITPALMEEAKEQLILRRETHLDQLSDKLSEERVRRVISPMLQGTGLGKGVRDDDIEYVIDLGLVHRGPQGPQIANAIYREVIPRQLNYITQLNFESMIEPAWYIAPDGRLDMDKLLAAFQQFFRENSEHWVERFDYKEAGPQLLLQAFLQRVVNGGGRIEREYGLGRGRTDLLLIWPYQDVTTPGEQTQKVVLELKVRHRTLQQTIAEGLAQTWEYMDRGDAQEGHLVVFDRAPGRPWVEKIFVRMEEYQGVSIKIWGM